MRIPYRPLVSLQEGCWFKLICGASYQHLPSIHNLALAYALAGADCIDVAADPAVVRVVKASFRVISELRRDREFLAHSQISIPDELPLLMVSISDGEDPHFRKAQFDPYRCPSDCSRPCETICPAGAIAFQSEAAGVLAEKCYGCGRCLPVCPIQNIDTVTRATSPATMASTWLQQVDAIEIHTQVGRRDRFAQLWRAIAPVLPHLSLISISCPDGDGVVDYLWQLYDIMQPRSLPLIWQTDGRSMSGDIGKGTTHATLRYAQKVLAAGPPGYVQLAGGTNSHTVAAWHQLSSPAPSRPAATAGAPQTCPTFGGIAYGSFARCLLSPLWDELSSAQSQSASAFSIPLRPATHDLDHLETSESHLIQAVQLAQRLVAPLKAARQPMPLSVTSPARDRAYTMKIP